MLIDGDNVQRDLLGEILAEAAKYGRVTTRRIYGDFTEQNMSGWKDTLNTHAIQPIQQYRYTTGKNATDIALIIDAMDLLHGGTVQGFCIVSSDSDYTKLAMRIQEQGLFVIGVGREQTPKPLVNACEVFVFTENLAPREVRQTTTTSIEPSGWIDMVSRAIEMATQEDEWAHLGAVGHYLRQLDPAFDPRSHGHRQLSQLIQSDKDLFELRQTRPRGGTSVFHVRLRS